jgi:ketosteroid isomerase-like protein
LPSEWRGSILALVSRENVDVHRRMVAAFNARDVEAMIACWDPKGEYHPVLATVAGVSAFHGHDGMRTWFADLEDALGDEMRAEPEAFYDLGERTLMFYVLRGRGRVSGAEVTSQFTQVARWRNNLAVYMKVYTDRDEALRDLGVSGDELEPIAP